MLTRILLLFCSIVFCFSTLFSQEKASDFPFPFSVGGSFSFRSVSGEGDDSRVEFDVYPTLAYQLNAHWQVGAVLNYNLVKSEYTALVTTFIYGPFIQVPGTEPRIIGTLTSSEERVDITIDKGVGLFARYAFNPQNKVRAILQPGFNLSTGKWTRETDNTVDFESRTRSYSATIQPGVIYVANPRINLIALLGSVGFLNRFEKGPNDDEFEKDRFEAFASLSGRMFFGAEYRF